MIVGSFIILIFIYVNYVVGVGIACLSFVFLNVPFALSVFSHVYILFGFLHTGIESGPFPDFFFIFQSVRRFLFVSPSVS